MLSLKQKIVLITGASSGIGAACAEQCAALGANVILAARRVERLQATAERLQQEYGVRVHIIDLDVRSNSAVAEAIATLPSEWQAIDILINNAGLAISNDPLQNSKPENWDVMIDTNLKGLLYVTHAILPGMLERQAGHIVNIGSIAGHEYYPGGNVYSATKHAVRAISKSLRIDLVGQPIRVSEVAPGAVETEFSIVRWQDENKAKQFYSDFNPLSAEDIADAVVYCITRPAHVNVAEVVVMPTVQGSANHLARAGRL